MLFLILFAITTADSPADQVIGKSNENNIVYCSQCQAYINTNTGEKVSMNQTTPSTAPVQNTDDAIIGR